MRNHVISIFTLLLSPALLISQQGFTAGYIIGPTGDTLRGEVKVNEKKPQEHYNKVMFRDDKGMQKTYKPIKIKGYGFGGNDYIAYTENEESPFYRVLAQGTLSLYVLMYE